MLGHVLDRKTGDEREREGRVDERPTPLGRCGVLRVEVDRVRVVREQREPDVVGLEYGAPVAASVDRPDLELPVRAAQKKTTFTSSTIATITTAIIRSTPKPIAAPPNASFFGTCGVPCSSNADSSCFST
jgi:hypothetical protein